MVNYFSDVFLLNSSYGKLRRSFVYVIIFLVGIGITTLISVSDGLDPYLFCREMDKTRSEKEGMDGEVFIPYQSLHFPIIDNMIKVLFP